MSNRLRQTGRMKMKKFLWFPKLEGETIAMSGAARLVRNLDGRHELIGGTNEQHAAAREWISLFAHDIVLAFP